MAVPFESAADASIFYRPFEPADINALGQVVNQPELIGCRYLPWQVQAEGMLNTAALEAVLEAWSTIRRGRRYGVFHKQDSALIGYCGMDWGWDFLCPEFELVLSPAQQRLGLGSAIAADIIDWLYDTTMAHNISAWFPEGNQAAQGFLTSLGFTYGGLSRAESLRQGKLRGEALMDLLRPEWQARRRS
jgi:RimJ/RimL family protein N-acetyltransferase